MLITSSMVLGKRRLQPIWFFGGVRMAGAFLVSDFGLLVMMLRAFSRDLPCCDDRAHCEKQKSCNSDRFFVSGLLGGPPRQCWDVVGPMRSGGGSGAGQVDSMQRQGIAWVRHRDVAPLPCWGTVWARHRDAVRARRCETRAVSRVWALARVSCRVIAFS